MTRTHKRDIVATTNRSGLWRAVAGWAVWAVGFTALYVAHSLACRYVGGAGIAPLPASGVGVSLLWLWAAFVAANGVLVALSYRRWRSSRAASSTEPEAGHFIAKLVFGLDISAMCAMLATGIPVFMLPACLP
ncbi:hypothetical protein [Bordetella sp. 02P26C-1]|uniref:hypothetical protein n=1 Tax=Bordetella sp. 02P26C-1 TaxID=2683195 RepID=UPI001352A017|nr:hypothetical protein [Bordetella sp. 02P26C-1]MVW78274.1 hypothetical protein [Bordetella sp. 02P26C-1]